MKKILNTASLAIASVLLAGCSMVASTSPAKAISVYNSANPVPLATGLSATNNVVGAYVDHSKEGVVLSASLDEYALPNTWAKVSGTGPYTLSGTTVTPTTTQTTLFVQGGDNAYYAKWVQLGTGTTAVVLTAGASSTSVVYTGSYNSATVTFPSSTLSTDAQAWYWTQMAAGNYSILKSATASDSFTGLTVPASSSWLKSATDGAVFTTPRNAALTYITGKVLIGTGVLPLTTKNGTWYIGINNTQVPSTWAFDTYYPILLSAYTATGSATVDAGTSASSD